MAMKGMLGQIEREVARAVMIYRNMVLVADVLSAGAPPVDAAHHTNAVHVKAV